MHSILGPEGAFGFGSEGVIKTSYVPSSLIHVSMSADANCFVTCSNENCHNGLYDEMRHYSSMTIKCTRGTFEENTIVNEIEFGETLAGAAVIHGPYVA